MKETWKIGMVGLGIMSTGITNNFIKNGNDVMVYDTNPDAVAKFADKAKVAADMAELLAANEIICMALPGSHVVEPVVEQMLSIGVEGKIIIDFSTSYPMSTKMLYGKVKAAGLDVWLSEKDPNWALAQHPAVSCTPHIGAGTKEAQKRIGAELVDIVENF